MWNMMLRELETVFTHLGPQLENCRDFGSYETFLTVSLTLNLVFFAFRGPVHRFVEVQAKATSTIVEFCTHTVAKRSNRPHETDAIGKRSQERLEVAANFIVFCCRLFLPIVAISTLYISARFNSNECIGEVEHWIFLSMAAPIVLGAALLYVIYLFAVIWHLFAALVLTMYWRKPNPNDADDILANYEKRKVTNDSPKDGGDES